MTAHINSRSGFTLMEVLIVIVVITVVGALGYTFYGRMNKQMASQTNETSIASDVKGAPEVTQTGDLDEAVEVLDQTDPASNESDLGQLDAMSSEF